MSAPSDPRRDAARGMGATGSSHGGSTHDPSRVRAAGPADDVTDDPGDAAAGGAGNNRDETADRPGTPLAGTGNDPRGEAAARPGARLAGIGSDPDGSAARPGTRLAGIGGVAGLVLVVGSAAAFGSGGPAAKAVLGAGVSSLQVVQARVCLTAVVLVAILAVVRPSALRVRRDEWPLLVAYGLLGFFAIQACYVLALSRLPVGVALLLEYLGPVLVVVWVRVVRRTVLPRTAWIGAVLAVAGLALMVQVWRGFRLDALGTIAGLGAAVGLAAYFLLSERGLGRDRDPVGLVAWGALVASVPLLVVTPPWTFPFDALAVGVDVGPWLVPAWGPLLWLALVSTVVAYLTGVAVLRHVPAAVASVLATIEVLFAAGFAWLLLGERLSGPQLIGGAVLFTGVVVVQARRPAPVPPPP